MPLAHLIQRFAQIRASLQNKKLDDVDAQLDALDGELADMNAAGCSADDYRRLLDTQAELSQARERLRQEIFDPLKH